MMSIKARLAKLERHGMTGGIPVWCDDEADVPATIQAMLAGGEITLIFPRKNGQG